MKNALFEQRELERHLSELGGTRFEWNRGTGKLQKKISVDDDKEYI